MSRCLCDTLGGDTELSTHTHMAIITIIKYRPLLVGCVYSVMNGVKKYKT